MKRIIGLFVVFILCTALWASSGLTEGETEAIFPSGLLVNKDCAVVNGELYILGDGFLDPIVRTRIFKTGINGKEVLTKVGGADELFAFRDQLLVLSYKKSLSDIVSVNFHEGVTAVLYDIERGTFQKWFEVNDQSVDTAWLWVAKDRLFYQNDGLYELTAPNEKKLILELEKEGEAYSTFFLIDTEIQKGLFGSKCRLTIYDYDTGAILSTGMLDCEYDEVPGWLYINGALFYSSNNEFRMYDFANDEDKLLAEFGLKIKDFWYQNNGCFYVVCTDANGQTQLCEYDMRSGYITERPLDKRLTEIISTNEGILGYDRYTKDDEPELVIINNR